MSEGPKIPMRTSSKRQAEDDLKRERNCLQDQLKRDEKRLKPQASYSSEYVSTSEFLFYID